MLFSHNITCTFLRIINVTQYLQREALRDKVICETSKDYWASKEAVHYKSIRQKLWKDNVLQEINLNIIKVKNYCDLTKATKSKYIKVQLLWNTLAAVLNSKVSTQCQRFPSLSCAALVRCLRYSFDQILSFHHVSSSPSNCSVSSSAASLSTRSAENLLALWKTCRKRRKNRLIKTFARPCDKATQWQTFWIQEHQLSTWPNYCRSSWARRRVRSIVGTHSGLL